MRNAFIDELCLLAEEDEHCACVEILVSPCLSASVNASLIDITMSVLPSRTCLVLPQELAMTGWTVITYSIARISARFDRWRTLRNDDAIMIAALSASR